MHTYTLWYSENEEANVTHVFNRYNKYIIFEEDGQILKIQHTTIHSQLNRNTVISNLKFIDRDISVEMCERQKSRWVQFRKLKIGERERHANHHKYSLPRLETVAEQPNNSHLLS